VLPAGVAAAVATTSTGSPAPTTSHTPRPVVSPWAGPLTTPCPPAAKSTAGPAVTDAPSAVPTVLTTDPVGGPLLGSTGVVVHPAAGVPAAPDITASSWVVADADTGDILAAKDPHGKYLPASTLKTLTAVTLIPRLDPCGVYTATKNDLHAECTCVGVADGQAYRIKMLFTAMLIYSGNDAADTLAGAYGGIPKTVSAMNAEAAYLKAYDTNAGTPSGLDTPGEHSSAYDLALIARAGLAMPDFKSYVSTRHVLFPEPKGKTQTLFTHVKLLPNYDGAIGVKNGFTVAAQATYIGAATRGGHTLIATLMHSTVGTAVWHEDAALLDWGFKAIGKVTPVGELVSPDLPPAPSTAASATTSSSAGAGTTTRSAQPTTVLTKAVEASATRKSSASSGTSVVLPVSLASAFVIAAAVVFVVLARRRKRQPEVSERALRF
jgi:D-alanyl-D-alanine carboxypeptidase (penicillin-binding protein 5/6)